MFLLCLNQDCASILSKNHPFLNFVVFQKFEDDYPIFQEKDGKFLKMTKPDVRCLGIISNVKTVTIASKIQKWWSQHMPVILPLLSYDTESSIDEKNLNNWLISILHEEANDFRNYFDSILTQNSVLRQNYDQMQVNFSAVENFISSNGLNYLIIQHDSNKVSDYWRPSVMGEELTQILPVSSNKLHCFAVYFDMNDTKISGSFFLNLKLSGSRKVIFQKEISFSNLKNGWNNFVLDRHVSEREDVILECKWNTKENMDQVPAIGLSNVHWHPTYKLQGIRETLTARSVALKIWSGLPGMKPPTIKDLAGATEDQEPQIIALDPEALSKFRRAQFPEDKLSVRYLADIARLEVHPSTGGVVAAVSADALPVGTSWISADIRTINPKADPIEYAMLIARSDDDAISQLAQNDFVKGSFSGWQVVDPNNPARITLIVSQTWHWDNRLYLATRLAPGSRPEAAWATWGGLEYGINDQNELVRSVLGVKPEMQETTDGLRGNLQRTLADPNFVAAPANHKSLTSL